jgi:ADP-heptose:LPS heptosyltransferase
MLPLPPSSPLRGKYLVRQPLMNRLLCLVDRLLALVQSPSPAAIPRPRRILLANGAHLGDVLLATAVVPVLKRAFPGCRIGFLVGKWAEAIVRGQPLIEHVHIVDHWKLNRAPMPLHRKLLEYHDTRRRALAAIRQARYDVAIDLYSYFPNSIPLLWQAGIPARIGYSSGGFGPLLTHVLDWRERNCHVIDYHADLLRRLLPDGELDRWSSLLAPLDLGRNAGVAPKQLDDYLVLHLGTGAACKEWPLDKWRTLARHLISAGQRLVFPGSSAQEKRNIRRVIHGLENCSDRCGELSWQGFVEVVRQARLVVGVDSVAGHVAAAVGTPCVVIVSGITNAAHWRPWSPRSRVLTHAVPCAPCYRNGGCEGMECVRGVEVEEVLRAVLELIGTPAPLAIPA